MARLPYYAALTDYYDILGLSTGAPAEAIELACIAYTAGQDGNTESPFRTLMAGEPTESQFDEVLDDARQQIIDEAIIVLGSPILRRRYDIVRARYLRRPQAPGAVVDWAVTTAHHLLTSHPHTATANLVALQYLRLVRNDTTHTARSVIRRLDRTDDEHTMTSLQLRRHRQANLSSLIAGFAADFEEEIAPTFEYMAPVQQLAADALLAIMAAMVVEKREVPLFLALRLWLTPRAHLRSMTAIAEEKIRILAATACPARAA